MERERHGTSTRVKWKYKIKSQRDKAEVMRSMLRYKPRESKGLKRGGVNAVLAFWFMALDKHHRRVNKDADCENV